MRITSGDLPLCERHHQARPDSPLLVVQSERKVSASMETSLSIVVLCQPLQWRIDPRVLKEAQAFCAVVFYQGQGLELAAEGEYKPSIRELSSCVCLRFALSITHYAADADVTNDSGMLQMMDTVLTTAHRTIPVYKNLSIQVDVHLGTWVFPLVCEANGVS